MHHALPAVPITIPAPPARRFNRPVSIRFEGHQWRQIEAVAARNGVTPAFAVRHLLERCLSAEPES
jgi:hypothetical protein